METHMKALTWYCLAMRSCAGLVCLALAAATAGAQAPDSSGPSATLTITPTDIPTSGRVTMKGMAFTGDKGQVRITVTPPGGAAAVFVTTPDATAHYSLMFGGTQAEGTYQVTAQVGTGVPAKASFTATTYIIDIDEDVADNKALLQESATFVTDLKKGVDNMPDSPARTDLEAKLTSLDEQTKKLPDQSAKLAQAFEHVKQMMTANPDAGPALQPFFDHLAVLDDQSKKERTEIDKEIAESEKNLAACDMIDHATVGIKAVPEMLAIAKRPFDFAVAFFTNMAASAAPSGAEGAIRAGGKLAAGLPKAAGSTNESLAEGEIELGSETETAERIVDHIPESVRNTPAYKFVVTETKQFVPSVVDGLGESNGSLHLFNIVTKLAGDIAAYANEQLFAKYCQKFVGDFTAAMTAHFFSKNNGPNGDPVEWWTFSTAIKGKLTLRYPKAAEGKAVQLTGQFEGGATRFTYKEDVFNSALFGKMTQGGIVIHRDLPPVATDDGEGGMVNALSSPTGFYVPVTGTLVDNTITVALQPARSDFNESYTRAHTAYTVMAKTTLGLPVLGHFSLPYMNAHFILDHLVSNSTNTFTVKRVGDELVIDEKRDKTLPGPQNSATYTMDLKACNPECE